MTRPILRLDTATLRRNIAAVQERIAPSALMLVVKDDAYGHGLPWAVETARASGVEWFGSFDVGSALEVRRVAGGQARIFAWVTSEDAEIDEAVLHDVDLGVGTIEYLRRVVDRAGRLQARARVHLKIDSGLHRNGVLPEDWAEALRIARDAERAGAIELVGVWSHIAEASDAEDDAAQAVFLEAVRAAAAGGTEPPLRHLTASAASWWRPELRGSLSRIGAFCYGVRSAEGPELDGIRPVATLVGTVTDVADGEATIAIGGFDGLPSTLVGAPVGTPAGARPLLRVGFTESAVAAWDGAAVGDEVRLFGSGECGEVSATDLAERLDTVGEEILTRLTPRVRRVVSD
ncbi:alanine racemase [Microbacterium sp. 179-I 3D4 NHS]|uniref:alanine racemase n=1 Tax=Microbacterium sp. 179-I 3D4 NHS TaxID=3142381 RepID=UPI00399F9462